MTYAGVSTASSDMTKISTIELGVAAANIDFTSIPSTYRNLAIYFQGKCSSGTTPDTCNLRINNVSDAAGYYSLHHQLLPGSTGSPITTYSSAASFIPVCHIPGNAAATIMGFALIEIPNYAQTGINRLVQARGSLQYSSNQANWVAGQYQGVYNYDTNAVTRVTLLPGGGNFGVGSSATLYGLP